MIGNKRMTVLAVLLGLVAAACGGGGDEPGGSDSANACRKPFEGAYTDVQAYPVFASTQVAVGENRFLVGLNNSNDAPIGGPEIDLKIKFYNLNSCPAEPASTEDMEFMWSIKPVVGYYRTQATFDEPGLWGAEVTASGPFQESVKGSFKVLPETSTPAIGEKAPASDTPTADDVKDLSEITTDENPNPKFYETSVADALKKGEPFVLAFATPKFCQSQTCGPTLDIVKDVVKNFPKVTVIHVEPYKLPADPANLVTVPAGEEWGLPSEPWVFVVDEKGKVAAKYEGAVAPDELTEQLKKL